MVIVLSAGGRMCDPTVPLLHAEFDMRVDLSEPLGTESLLFASLAGKEVQAKMLNPRPVNDGERLRFQLDLTRCHLFDAETEQSLR